jgi:hypothetical protein
MDGCGADGVLRNVASVVVTPDGRVAYATGEGGITTTFVVSYRIDSNGALSARIGCVVDQPAASAGCRAGNQGFPTRPTSRWHPTTGLRRRHRRRARRWCVADPGGIAALSVDANTLGLTGAINCVEAGGAGCPRVRARPARLQRGRGEP